MHYLRWSKVHPRVEFELTASGVPSLPGDALCRGARSVSLEVRGPYGAPEVKCVLAGLYGVAADRVLPVPGTSSANFIALGVAASRGDTVLVERPVYDPLLRAAAFLGLTVKALERKPETAFDAPVDALDAGLSAGARAVVISNLHNPSGRRLTPDVVRELAGRCAENGATLIVDEVYLDAAHICLQEPRWSAAALRDNVIATGSLSKVYGLSGLRSGWLLGSGAVIERARDVMDLLSVDNSAPSAELSLLAWSKLDMLEDRYRNLHQRSRGVFLDWIEREPALKSYPNYGALFECLGLPGRLSSDRLNQKLVEDFDTQVVPGSFFGLDNHIRVGLGVEPDVLAEGLSRISRALRELQ